MQITLEQVYERLQEFRDQSQKDMKELRQDMDGKFASMRTWVVSLFIGGIVLTGTMVGVFTNAVILMK